MSQADVFYQAMLARDYRFDGKFFVAVKTTGIYCRPICPAKPKRKNVEFFTTAIQAENAGYRPCLRCRPESAPFSPAWYGKSAVVQRALRLIAAGRGLEQGEDRFAAQFGMSARHLRRIFEDEIGQTPKQIFDNNRLGFARKLIVETKMPVTRIAETAGFRSLRRFNDAFLKRFARAPSQMRKTGTPTRSSGGLELDLPYRPPYDWASILRFFESHQISGLEKFDGKNYERVFEMGGEVGWLRVSPDVRPGKNSLRLKVVLHDPKHLFSVVTRVRRMFDLDSDPLLIANSFAQVKPLDRLYKKFPGVRMPGAWDGFESAVCTVLGQFVSVEHARRLIHQLVENYGRKSRHPVTGEHVKLFPYPEILAKASLQEVKTTNARKATIRELAQKYLNGEIDFSDAQDPTQFREALLSIRGIGPWSAEYISLRAIGDTNAFPRTDLILQRALEIHPALDLESIKPWQGYAAIYLWKEFAGKLSRKTSKTQRSKK